MISYLPHHKRTAAIGIAAIIVIAFAVLQDFIEAKYQHYSFYISESALFGIHWLLFLPLGGLLLWWIEKQKSKSTSILPRLIFVLISTIVIHFLVFSVLVNVLSEVFFDHTYDVAGVLNFALSSNLYITLLVYVTLAFVSLRGWRTKQRPTTTISQHEGYIDKLIVATGRTQVVLNVADILSVTSSSPYVAIHVQDKYYLHQDTLKAMGDKLNPKQFVRIHKSTIINIQKVASYQSRLNGDYDVVLVNQQKVRLSRNYLPQFKAAFEQVLVLE